MQHIYKITLTSIFLLFFSLSSFAHVNHYENLNSIEFDIYRNNQNIGKHIFSFKRSGKKLTVDSEIHFEIKKFGATLYKYHVKGSEVYENGFGRIFTKRSGYNCNARSRNN